MAAKSIPADDVETLRWSGMMGHAFVVLTDGRGRSEVNDKDRAIEQAREYGKLARPRIYQQVRAGKWKPVAFKDFD